MAKEAAIELEGAVTQVLADRGYHVEENGHEVLKTAGGPGRTLVYDAKGAPLILFDSERNTRTVTERDASHAFYDVVP